ncbi:MAG: biotin--[acetyl-CoA-carboxylase] ligase [Saprospiraceae bacterium]
MFDNLTSTNEYALSLLSKSKPIEGTVISARFQTAGKGQIGSSWQVEADKNLTLSVILYPNFLPVAQQFYLSQAVALAVADFIQIFIAANLVKIKWPNDVYIGNKKTAGILIQNTISGSNLQTSVIGLGININQLVFPATLPNPTSIGLETGKADYPLDEVSTALCACLESRYLQLKAQQWQRLSTDYLSKLYRIGEQHLFKRADNRLFEGEIVGTSISGQLKIATPLGIETFNMKEVTFAN